MLVNGISLSKMSKAIMFSITLLLFSSTITSAKCVLIIQGKAYDVDVDNLHCQDFNLAPSDICRDYYTLMASGSNTGNTGDQLYVQFKNDKFPLASDEGQAKLLALIKANNGKVDTRKFGAELARIEAKKGKTSRARLDALYSAAKKAQSK